MKTALKRIIKNSFLWRKCKPLIRERQILSKEKKKFIAEAKECFNSNPGAWKYERLLGCVE